MLIIQDGSRTFEYDHVTHLRMPINNGARCVRQNESPRYCHDVHPSVCLSVCLSGTGVHSGALQRGFKFTVEQSHAAGTLTPNHIHLLPAIFSSSTWKRGGVCICKLGEELNASNKKCVGECYGLRLDYRRRLWAPTSASRAISAIAELLVVNCFLFLTQCS